MVGASPVQASFYRDLEQNTNNILEKMGFRNWHQQNLVAKVYYYGRQRFLPQFREKLSAMSFAPMYRTLSIIQRRFYLHTTSTCNGPQSRYGLATIYIDRGL